jgi:hypothetical protein
MVTSKEYNQLAQRCARLAIACSVPSIAGALTLLALDYRSCSNRACASFRSCVSKPCVNQP